MGRGGKGSNALVIKKMAEEMNSKKYIFITVTGKQKVKSLEEKKKKSTEVNEMSSNFLRMKQNYNMACCSYCLVLGMP